MKKCLAGVLAAVMLALPNFAAAAETASAGALTMELKNKYYDQAALDLDIRVENGSSHAYEVRAGFQLERLVSGVWYPAEKADDAPEKVWNTIPLEAGGKYPAGLRLDGFRHPLTPGTYRVTKTFLPSGQSRHVELREYFQVMDPARNIPMASVGAVRLKNRVGGAAVETVFPLEDYDGNASPFTIAMEELRHFQMADPPDEKALSKLDLSVALEGPSGQTGSIAFYQGEFAVYARYDGGWYIAPDLALPQRLQKLFSGYGSASAAAETLIGELKKVAGSNGLSFSKHSFSTPFAYPGWRAKISEAGEQVAIFQFPDAASAREQLKHVTTAATAAKPGVYSVGLPDAKGGYTSVKTCRWAFPPHYYQFGPLVVLYNGDDAETKGLLKFVMGPEKAGTML